MDKTIEILRQWHEAGMIMPENLPDLADEILALVSEDEVCHSCKGERTIHSGATFDCPDCKPETDTEIALRVLRKFNKQTGKSHLLDIIQWLTQQKED